MPPGTSECSFLQFLDLRFVLNASLSRDWYVLYVKPRTEKKVEALLAGYRYWHYLPKWVKVTKVQRRKVRTELPLFPGYVFTRLDADARRKMLQSNLLVRVLPVSNPREMVHQLRQIARAARHAPELRVVHPFKAGDLVRVKTGPFRGLEGFMKREGPAATIVINLEILGQAIETVISPADCEPAQEKT